MKEDPKTYSELADQIIRNTYRTLMTRGQKGCFVYCTDANLSKYLSDRLQKTKINYQVESRESLVAEKKQKY